MPNHVHLRRSIPRLTGADLIEISRSSREDPFLARVARHLGCPPESIRSVRGISRAPFHLNALANLGRLLDERTGGQADCALLAYENHGRQGPEFAKVRLTAEESLEVLIAGTRLVTVDGIPLAVHCYGEISFGEEEVVHLEVAHDGRRADARRLVRDLLAELERRLETHNIYRGRAIDFDLDPVDAAGVSWDDLVLPPQSLALLETNTVDLLARSRVYAANGLPFRRGVILHGPPGTGKTLAGKVLAANRGEATFVWVYPRHLENAEHVRHVYRFARRCRPAIVFVEDVDVSILGRDECPFNPTLGELLAQLDGPVENAGVVTILTTNHFDRIEPALRDRPGRIDVEIEFSLPAAPERTRLLERFASPRAAGPIDYATLAGRAEGLSGAEIREWTILASIHALEGGSVSGEGLVRLEERHLAETLPLLLPDGGSIGFGRQAIA